MPRIRKQLRRTMNQLDRNLDPARHGSVLILVVVLLVLMALLGTAYLVTARNDRVATRLYEHNVQIDMLVQGVENMAMATLGDTSYQTSDVQYYDDFMTDGTPTPTNANPIDHSWLAARYPGLLGPSQQMPTGSPSETLGSLPASGVPLYPVPKGAMVQVAGTGQMYQSLVDNNTANVTTAGNWAQVTSSLLTTTTPVWPAVSSPLVVNAVAEDLRYPAVASRPDGVRTYCAPTSIQINGGNFPALTYYSLVNNTVETAMAASASGNGIADSFLWRLPIGTIDGITYYAAVRIIDNGSQINLNTAMSSSTDYLGDGTSENVSDGFSTGMFSSGIGLMELTNSFTAQGSTPFVATDTGNPEINQVNLTRFFGFARPNGIQTNALYPPTSLTTPTDDTGASRPDFVYKNLGDALHSVLGRRVNHPGYVAPGVAAQAFSWSDAAALAYRFDLANPNASPSVTEQDLVESVWNTSSSTPGPFAAGNATNFQALPWDPSQVTTGGSLGTGWFGGYNDTPAQVAGTYTPRNRRPFFTTHNPVSNWMPAHSLTPTVTGLSQAQLNSVLPYMANMSSPYGSAQYGSGVVPKVSINTVDVTTADYGMLGNPVNFHPKGPTLWLGFYNAMLDATTAIPGFMNTPGAGTLPPNVPPGTPIGAGVAQFRSPIRDVAGFGFNANTSTTFLSGPQTLLLRSLLAAVNAKDLRDTGDNVTFEGISGFPATVPGTINPTAAAVFAYGTERQVFITEVYANTETIAPGFVGAAQTTVNPNAGKTNPKGYVSVELYNPYDYPVDMTWWTLAVVTRSGNPQKITANPINGFLGFNNDGQQTNAVIPPKSYLVLENMPPSNVTGNPGVDATYRPYTSYLISQGKAAPVVPPASMCYYVPNLDQVINDPVTGTSGELVLLRQIYAQPKAPSNVDPKKFVDPTTLLNNISVLPAVDSFDFTGVTPNGGPNTPVQAIHYVRANPGATPGVQTTTNWKFVYPGRWDPAKYSPYRQEGINTLYPPSTWTAPMNPAAAAPAGQFDTWADAIPGPTIAMGAADATATYVNNFPAIQLNNTDFGGPNKCYATQPVVSPPKQTPFVFPFGAFARIGDILQTPFIGSYTILSADGKNIIEINPVTRDCATADDQDGGVAGPGNNDPVEQIGRFCPLLAAEQTNITPPESYIAPNSYDSYAWASHIFNYFSVLDNPNDDYFPDVDPNDYACGPWNMSPLPQVAPPYAYNSAIYNFVTPFGPARDVANTTNAGNGPNRGTEDALGVEGLININTASWRVLAAVPWIPTTNGTTDLQNNEYIAQAIVTYRNTYGPFKTLFDLNRVTITPNQSLQNYRGNPAVTDFNPTNGDISPNDITAQTTGYSGSTSDYVTNDFETRFNMITRASNCVTTRSDTFTVYVLVQGWSNVGTLKPTLVVQRRAAFIEDRTALTPTNSTPNLIQVQTN